MDTVVYVDKQRMSRLDCTECASSSGPSRCACDIRAFFALCVSIGNQELVFSLGVLGRLCFFIVAFPG